MQAIYNINRCAHKPQAPVKVPFKKFDILKDFYNDSTIKKIISDNFPKFVKGSFETNSQVIEILDDKIEARKDDVFE